MRVVVVGATGNVGTALLRRLAGEPEIREITGIARRVPTLRAGHPYTIANWRSIDIGADDARERLTQAFTGADAVVSLAWAIAPSHQTKQLERINVGGNQAVIDAVRAAQVPHYIYASSVGAYAPGPLDHRPVDESWPATGIEGSDYSEQKAQVERILGEAGALPDAPLITRVRSALVFQRDAGSEIHRYFLGHLFPAAVLRLPIPVVPVPADWRIQVVHADDEADAYARMLLRRVGGAFNIATDPVLAPEDVARLLRGRQISAPTRLLYEGARFTWHARLQPTSHGWIKMAAQVPVLDSSRARTELGWMPRRDAYATFRELMRGIADHAGTGSPALRPRGIAQSGLPIAVRKRTSARSTEDTRSSEETV
jgi:UDP-glucose 4-epimerase